MVVREVHHDANGDNAGGVEDSTSLCGVQASKRRLICVSAGALSVTHGSDRFQCGDSKIAA